MYIFDTNIYVQIYVLVMFLIGCGTVGYCIMKILQIIQNYIKETMKIKKWVKTQMKKQELRQKKKNSTKWLYDLLFNDK